MTKIPLFPFLDLKAQYATIRGEIVAAIMRTLESQQFILGPEVQALEKELADFTASSSAIACASGTDALILALRSLNIGPGDEVITTPFTFVASAGSIVQVGATPKFVDIHPDTFNLDPEKLENAITARTKAIMPIHLFGLPAAMNEINAIAARHGLPVVEDAAQALGSAYKGRPAGSLGTIGCFSFFPSKNLGGAGDGGLITTSDASLAEKLKLLHLHGARERYEYEIVGMNSRLDALQAAILRVKFRHLEVWNAARRRNAERYRAMFEEFQLCDRIVLPGEPSDMSHIYNQFTIRVKQRDQVRENLRRRGIPSEIYYPMPLHLQKAFACLGYEAGDFPIAEAASKGVLSLPIYAELTEEQQRTIVSAIAGSISS
jgi:dTDP-4-amino-4,6-dideoxygalactose transaminase